MKTVRSSSQSKQGNFFARNLYKVVMVSTLVVLGAVVTMTILLNRGNDDQQTVTPPPPAPTYVMPLTEYEIAQDASLDRLIYNPTLNEWRTVNGTIFSVKEDIDVHSVSDGQVVDVQDTQLEGVVVKIDHGDGIVSTYMSLAENPAVEVGQKIKAGDVIGQTSDHMSKYAHFNNQLYLEVKQAGKLIDPMTILPNQEV
ncbi:MAG: M23 family metallopeptidase [Firmicutes bacterium]|nr:M23 family metallopeptidase [Bacillota bacterium]MCL1954298.1 M23 family metallopeptidase [Bacillota bacterium]